MSISVKQKCRLLRLAEVTVEWGVDSTTVYTQDGVIQWTDDREYKEFTNTPLSYMVQTLRERTGEKVIIHRHGNSRLDDLVGPLNHHEFYRSR